MILTFNRLQPVLKKGSSIKLYLNVSSTKIFLEISELAT